MREIERSGIMSDCCKKSPGIDTQDKHEPRFEMC